MTTAPSLPPEPEAAEPEPTPAAILTQQLRTVAQLRREAAVVGQRLKAGRLAWEAEHGPDLALGTRLKGQVDEAERLARDVALAVYHQDPEHDKHPAPGVTIKVGTKLTYTPEEAFAWAKAKELALVPVALDAKEFERIIKGMKEPPTFVKVDDDPAAQLATDLDKALGLEPPAAPAPLTSAPGGIVALEGGVPPIKPGDPF